MDIDVARLDTADLRAVERAYEIGRESLAADVPDLPPLSRPRFMGGVRMSWPGETTEYVVATVGGAAAGLLTLFLPQLENTNNVRLQLAVHPAHRRRGVGRALHSYAKGRAVELGRGRLMGVAVAQLPHGPARSPAGAHFAAAVGGKPALTEVRRRLDLSTVDFERLDLLLGDAWTRAAGYTLVQWCGSAPDECVADVAYLDGRLVEDAPMGDLTIEPQKVDAARVRGVEAALAAWQIRTYHSGLRDDSGRLVAWTTLSMNQGLPWHAFQQITIVDPAHRGHRLGTVVKIENLRYALEHEPELRVIDTFNAATNDHMIAINEAMGFRPVDAWENWQQEI
jgi:GNAT superfamily N-acetyltransferase